MRPLAVGASVRVGARTARPPPAQRPASRNRAQLAIADGQDHTRARSRSPRQVAAAATEVDDEEDLRRVRRRFEAPNLAAAMPVDTDTDAMARMARPPESCTEVLQICHDYVMGQIAPQIAEITNRLRDDIDAHDHQWRAKVQCGSQIVERIVLPDRTGYPRGRWGGRGGPRGAR